MIIDNNFALELIKTTRILRVASHSIIAGVTLVLNKKVLIKLPELRNWREVSLMTVASAAAN